jgi:aerobic-type carbon monoxide dehydrogenase small subunit (CoxS/CutS family)
MIRFEVNGVRRDVADDPSTPLLWVLRDTLGLKGSKFGCGGGYCGACTVHIDGAARRSCVTPVSAVGGAEVTTIEGLARNGELHPVQRAWIDEDVSQCGYCQAGQIMQAVAMLESTPRPDDARIDEAMAGNLCRCGTYLRIRRAIRRAAGMPAGTGGAGA